MERELNQETKKVDPFYNSERWEHLRQCILRRDGFMCQEAKRYGKMIPATVVHHILPRENFPEYQWCDWNLISLSETAHAQMHYRTTRELTKKGKELLIRTARRRGLDIESIEQQLRQQDRKTKRILVIGLRGSGKTTYCRNQLKANEGANDLVYDLDAIASSFRLKREHEEVVDAARRMANDYLPDFIAKAEEYEIKKIYIIRAAPPIEEVERIRPDLVVYCDVQYIERPMEKESAAITRIIDLLRWCEEKNVEVLRPGAEKRTAPLS